MNRATTARRAWTTIWVALAAAAPAAEAADNPLLRELKRRAEFPAGRVHYTYVREAGGKNASIGETRDIVLRRENDDIFQRDHRRRWKHVDPVTAFHLEDATRGVEVWAGGDADYVERTLGKSQMMKGILDPRVFDLIAVDPTSMRQGGWTLPNVMIQAEKLVRTDRGREGVVVWETGPLRFGFRGDELAFTEIDALGWVSRYDREAEPGDGYSRPTRLVFTSTAPDGTLHRQITTTISEYELLPEAGPGWFDFRTFGLPDGTRVFADAGIGYISGGDFVKTGALAKPVGRPRKPPVPAVTGRAASGRFGAPWLLTAAGACLLGVVAVRRLRA